MVLLLKSSVGVGRDIRFADLLIHFGNGNFAGNL